MKIYNSKLLVFLSLILVFVLFSCKKKGCTDLLALNYDNEAAQNDGSCNYQSEHFVGQYSVTDSLNGGIIPYEWYSRNYSIEIKQNKNNLSQIIIKNWANLHPNLSAEFTHVIGQVEDNQFMVTYQDIAGREGYNARDSKGEVIGDSIFFNIEFTNFFGEIFWGAGRGKRIE